MCNSGNCSFEQRWSGNCFKPHYLRCPQDLDDFPEEVGLVTPDFELTEEDFEWFENKAREQACPVLVGRSERAKKLEAFLPFLIERENVAQMLGALKAEFMILYPEEQTEIAALFDAFFKRHVSERFQL